MLRLFDGERLAAYFLALARAWLLVLLLPLAAVFFLLLLLVVGVTPAQACARARASVFLLVAFFFLETFASVFELTFEGGEDKDA